MLLPILLAAGLGSCSVKEDRLGCPCLLELDVSGGELDRDVFSVWEQGLELCDTLRLENGNASYECEIPKGRPTLAVWSGEDRCVRAGTCLTVPEGSEMDEIYAWSEQVDSRAESISRKASLHRQFAYIHLTVAFQSGEESPFLLRLCGNVAGLDLRSLAPVTGGFAVSFLPVVGDYHRICVPRQKDDSLVLEFRSRSDPQADPEGIFPLGERIRDAGYDWNAPDLSDIYVDLDYVRAGISVRIEEWKKGRVQDETI